MAAPVNRRRFLAFVAWGTVSTFLPAGAEAARLTRPSARRLSFHQVHTDERCSVCYWENGAYVPEALEQIDALLRDHRTGEIKRIEPRLIDVVHSLTVQLGSTSPVRVISGYRSIATNNLLRGGDPAGVAAHSLHLSGEAVDISIDNRPLNRVRDAARSLRAGGVGYYPGSGFVHLDIGRPRSW